MKKILLTLMFGCSALVCANAQDVYKEIQRLSKETANNKSKDLLTRKIATFKVDELDYMAQRTRELMPDSAVSVLDYQAYAMYEYVNLFIKRYTNARKKKDKTQIIETFKLASLQNSRFHDMDEGLVHAYINTEGYITKFSLDTDWVKALADVRQRLRKL